MPDRGWSIEVAAPQDAGSLVRLVRASLPTALRRLTIWSSPRAAFYVRDLLGGACPGAHHRFYLLRRGSAPAGLAAFRLLEGAAFLNHLYIAPRYRGCSLGSLLLEAAARRYLARHPAPEIGLDVFARSRRATAWYRRLGFEQRARLGWWISVRGVCAATGRPPAALAAAAARQHRAWGFSQFAARTRAGRYQVGRLYAPFFRLTDPRAAADPDLLAALARLNPRRRLLLIAPASAASPGRSAGWEQVAQSRRLRARSAVLLRRLAAARRARRVTAPEILELENLEREKVRHLL